MKTIKDYVEEMKKFAHQDEVFFLQSALEEQHQAFLDLVESNKKEIYESDKWGEFERGVLQGYNKGLNDLLLAIKDNQLKKRFPISDEQMDACIERYNTSKANGTLDTDFPKL